MFGLSTSLNVEKIHGIVLISRCSKIYLHLSASLQSANFCSKQWVLLWKEKGGGRSSLTVSKLW